MSGAAAISQPFYISERGEKPATKIFEPLLEAVTLLKTAWKTGSTPLPGNLWETMRQNFFSADFHREEHEPLIMFYTTGG
jgi:hypothetical protein